MQIVLKISRVHRVNHKQLISRLARSRSHQNRPNERTLHLFELKWQMNFDSEVHFLPINMSGTSNTNNFPINADWNSPQNMQTFYFSVVRKFNRDFTHLLLFIVRTRKEWWLHKISIAISMNVTGAKWFFCHIFWRGL